MTTIEQGSQATEPCPSPAYTGIIPDHCPGWCDTDHAQVWEESVHDIDAAREHFLSGGQNSLEEQRWNDHVLRARWPLDDQRDPADRGAWLRDTLPDRRPRA